MKISRMRRDVGGALVGAALAGLLGAAFQAQAASSNIPKDKLKKTALVPCYGINSCKSNGGCAQTGHECAAQNSCKGQGWVAVPKDACTKIAGGSLTPIAQAAADK
jgi:uncharacterized membrane protein